MSESLPYEASPSHVTPREAYELNYAEIIQYLGRITAEEAANFRIEQPRSVGNISAGKRN